MSVDYRHDYIELYSLCGGNATYPEPWRGIWINGKRPSDSLAQRSFNLYLFDPFGNVKSIKHYDLYGSFQAGNLIEPNRMIADLNALPNGQVFAIITFDEPALGHMKKFDGTDNVELMNALYRVGVSPSIYGVTWKPWCAYMLLGTVGRAPYFEKFDDTPRADSEVYGNAVIYQAFSIVNNKFVPYKYQNKISAKINSLWKEGQAFYYKQLNKWKRVRRVYLKVGGVWKKIYVRNHFEAYSMGLRQNLVSHTLRGLVVNNQAVNPTGRSYGIYMFNEDGTFLTNQQYDIFGDGPDLFHTNRMINDLNAMPRGQPFVIVTYDEPQLGHLRPGLPEAMYRIGATPEIFGQPMGYRGAYMLAGNAETNIVIEHYVGDNINPGDANTGGALDALVYFSFTVHHGEIHQIPDKAV